MTGSFLYSAPSGQLRRVLEARCGDDLLRSGLYQEFPHRRRALRPFSRGHGQLDMIPNGADTCFHSHRPTMRSKNSQTDGSWGFFLLLRVFKSTTCLHTNQRRTKLVRRIIAVRNHRTQVNSFAIKRLRPNYWSKSRETGFSECGSEVAF